MIRGSEGLLTYVIVVIVVITIFLLRHDGIVIALEALLNCPTEFLGFVFVGSTPGATESARLFSHLLLALELFQASL
jgi:hypothetical protein